MRSRRDTGGPRPAQSRDARRSGDGGAAGGGAPLGRRPVRRLPALAIALPLLLGLGAGAVAGCGAPATDDADADSASVARADDAGAPAEAPGPEAGSGAGTGTPDAQAGPSASPSRDGEPPRFDLAEMGFTAGAPDAPIRVIEFSDFGCGYCRRFHLRTYPTLHDQYVETGKVRWKYVPFVLGSFPNGREAAHAGECAIEQGGFPPFRRRLFEDQPEWRGSDRPEELFVRVAAEEGLDEDRFRSCLEEGRHADRVRDNVELGRRVGVRGTPTFVIQGYPLQGAQPVPVFREIFEQLLAAAERR